METKLPEMKYVLQFIRISDCRQPIWFATKQAKLKFLSETESSATSNWCQFHSAAKQETLLTRQIWLQAKLSYKMYAFWLVVCLSSNIY